MRRFLPALACTVFAAAFALVAAPRADAWKAPCIPGTKRPTCHFWKGKVTFVADGDTLDVNVSGDGKSAIRVRMTGINAMEQSAYSSDPARRKGACHALAATARLEQLTRANGGYVRLSAQDPGSRAGTRYRRSVAVRLADGRWHDIGQILINEGHVLWLPSPTEWAWNSRYSAGAQRAAAAGLHVWDSDACGAGAEDAARLKMWVNWDADGTDGAGNLNGEWVKIKNESSSDVSIGGWWFRDSFVVQYNFPSSAVIPAGGTITLYVGSRPLTDANTATHFYWGRGHSVFDNVFRRTGLGDGGYLFDPHGDLRVRMIYPCRYGCSDPVKGKIVIRARASAPEEVFARNVSTSRVDLEGYVVENPPYVYSFGPATILNPGERVRLVVRGSRSLDTALVKHWGKSKYILNDSGDKARLRTAANTSISCYAWGSMAC